MTTGNGWKRTTREVVTLYSASEAIDIVLHLERPVPMRASVRSTCAQSMTIAVDSHG